MKVLRLIINNNNKDLGINKQLPLLINTLSNINNKDLTTNEDDTRILSLMRKNLRSNSQ